MRYKSLDIAVLLCIGCRTSFHCGNPEVQLCPDRLQLCQHTCANALIHSRVQLEEFCCTHKATPSWAAHSVQRIAGRADCEQPVHNAIPPPWQPAAPGSMLIETITTSSCLKHR